MQIKTTYYKKIQEVMKVHFESTKMLNSGNHYIGQIEHFLFYLETNEIYSLKAVNKDVMGRYFTHLTNRPKLVGVGKLSNRTINDNLSTLRMFSKRMLQDRTIEKGLPIPNNIKIEKKEDIEGEFNLTREILSIDEIKEVYKACNNELERALLAMAYGCGLRRFSLANLKDIQVNYTNGVVSVEKAKNNKTFEVTISDFFMKDIKAYNRWRLNALVDNHRNESSFFVDCKGKPLDGDKLNKMLKNIIGRTKNPVILSKNITLHNLRHSIATHILNFGYSFEYVKAFLGHAFTDTSSIYAKRRNIKTFYTI